MGLLPAVDASSKEGQGKNCEAAWMQARLVVKIRGIPHSSSSMPVSNYTYSKLNENAYTFQNLVFSKGYSRLSISFGLKYGSTSELQGSVSIATNPVRVPCGPIRR